MTFTQSSSVPNFFPHGALQNTSDGTTAAPPAAAGRSTASSHGFVQSCPMALTALPSPSSPQCSRFSAILDTNSSRSSSPSTLRAPSVADAADSVPDPQQQSTTRSTHGSVASAAAAAVPQPPASKAAATRPTEATATATLLSIAPVKMKGLVSHLCRKLSAGRSAGPISSASTYMSFTHTSTRGVAALAAPPQPASHRSRPMAPYTRASSDAWCVMSQNGSVADAASGKCMSKATRKRLSPLPSAASATRATSVSASSAAHTTLQHRRTDVACSRAHSSSRRPAPSSVLPPWYQSPLRSSRGGSASPAHSAIMRSSSRFTSRVRELTRVTSSSPPASSPDGASTRADDTSVSTIAPGPTLRRFFNGSFCGAARPAPSGPAAAPAAAA
eukprot:Rhum_TRINITY_DN13530_c0_g1::Rhum_TRINITY_DN13530_c0_g1_i1::g.61098::m.61098